MTLMTGTCGVPLDHLEPSIGKDMRVNCPICHAVIFICGDLHNGSSAIDVEGQGESLCQFPPVQACRELRRQFARLCVERL